MAERSSDFYFILYLFRLILFFFFDLYLIHGLEDGHASLVLWHRHVLHHS